MPDADHFRRRAVDCRALAKTAATIRDSSLLLEIADELDAEAELIDSRQTARMVRENHWAEDADAPPIIRMITGGN